MTWHPTPHANDSDFLFSLSRSVSCWQSLHTRFSSPYRCRCVPVCCQTFRMCLLHVNRRVGEWRWRWIRMNVEGDGKWQPEWPFSKMSQRTRRALPKWWHLSLSGAFSLTVAGAEATIDSSVLFWLSPHHLFPPFLCIWAFSFQFLLLCWTPPFLILI